MSFETQLSTYKKEEQLVDRSAPVESPSIDSVLDTVRDQSFRSGAVKCEPDPYAELEQEVTDEVNKAKLKHPELPAKKEGDEQTMFFCTDRAPIEDAQGKIVDFSKALDGNPPFPPHFGLVEIDRPGVMPKFSAPGNEVAANPHSPSSEIEHIYQNRDEFNQAVYEATRHSTAHKAIIYEQGFATSFRNASATGAAIQKACRDEGLNIPVIVYSPPSRDAMRLSQYDADEESFQRSLMVNGVPIISGLERKCQSRNIISIAHSMGNQNETEYAWSRKGEVLTRPMYAQFACRSDTDGHLVAARIKEYAQSAKHNIFYYSPADKALHVSGDLIHNNKRTGNYAGDLIKPDSKMPGVELIDDSADNNGTTNHVIVPKNIAKKLKEMLIADGEVTEKQLAKNRADWFKPVPSK